MKRIAELDAVRGLAALCILSYHLWFTGVALLGTAVDLFFVLSGFLITGILLDHRMSERFLVSFYARRALRIWPIYYLCLAALVVINPITPRPGALDGLAYYLTYTQKLPHYWRGLEPAFLPAFRHTWTLAIEEQFYLIWPALIFLLGRRALAPLSAAFVVVAVTARALGANPWILLSHCDGLALGGLLAGLLKERRGGVDGRRPGGLGFVLIGAGAIGVALCAGPASRFLNLPAELRSSLKLLAVNAVFFSTVGLVVLGAGGPALAWLRDRRLCYLGQISYGLYLYHHVVYFLLDDWAEAAGIAGGPWLDLAKLAASFALAVASWHFIEQPILRLKDRFGYQPAPAPDAGVPELPGLGAVR